MQTNVGERVRGANAAGLPREEQSSVRQSPAQSRQDHSVRRQQELVRSTVKLFANRTNI